MSSKAFESFFNGSGEVQDILDADPGPLGGLSEEPETTRALTRAALVMLYGHFERYVRESMEEAVDLMNIEKVEPGLLPITFKLRHSRKAVRRMSEMAWEKRETALGEFITMEGWLWADVPAGKLDIKNLLEDLKSPTPKTLMKLYSMWGVPDIFRRITRKPQMRRLFWLSLEELVHKRNNIAHGDFAVETTQGDVRQYVKIASEFCRRTDGVLAMVLQQRMRVPCAW
ncbi:MAE_28990/MAE_18760 family HEPN-like nuclease [Candidatus Palauibacter sp.]|uniref:MAE_28990/MAE_18760 family HEPN-like nuclease n=1 Tax=Candidatus Palauibacter sp. TaxID=3101350 RepID=UPI003B51FF03